MRVGIIINDLKVPAWVWRVIQEVNRLNTVEWAVVIRLTTVQQSSEHMAFRFFRKIDSLILPTNPTLGENEGFRLLQQVPEITINQVTTGENIALSTDDLNSLTEARPDLIFHFGSNSLRGAILEIPKFGVWCLRFGNPNQLASTPSCFWEWFYGQPVTHVNLMRLSESAAGDECLGHAATRTEQLSYGRNLRAGYSLGVELISALFEKIVRNGILPLKSDTVQMQHKFHEGKPRFMDSLLAIVVLFKRLLTKLIRKTVFLEQWVLFYSFQDQNLPQLDFEKFKELIPPKDRIWADPFVISKDGKHYLFIEELLRKTNKGHISCLVMNETGEIEVSKLLIDKPYHLSYPFLFQYENTWYMIPESAEGKTVDLFECTDFPFHWKFKRSLLSNVEAFDSTVHFHEGRFWLFCTIKKTVGGSSDDHLYLFHTNDLLEGDWLPHQNNPVLSDPTSARPAGRVFIHDQILYRPSQICVPRYGYGLCLNKISELTDSSYKEETVSRALPTWRKDLLSVHTFNFSNGITLIDGQLKRIKFL